MDRASRTKRGIEYRVYKGIKENGAVFSRPNPMGKGAECKLSRGFRGNENLRCRTPVQIKTTRLKSVNPETVNPIVNLYRKRKHSIRQIAPPMVDRRAPDGLYGGDKMDPWNSA